MLIGLPKISDNLGSRFTEIDLISKEPYAQYVTIGTYYTIVPAATSDYEIDIGHPNHYACICNSR
jgi:hypothetical protein